MKENGRMMFNMDTEKKDGLMDRVIKDRIIRVQSTGSDCTNGRMVLNTTVIGITMLLKESEFIHGSMVESIEENGKTLICTVLALINGQMEECLLENMITIKSTVTVSTLGQMIENTEDGGKRENKMDLESM